MSLKINRNRGYEISYKNEGLTKRGGFSRKLSTKSKHKVDMVIH